MKRSLDFSYAQDDYVLSFYEALGTVRALTCAILYRYGEYRQLTSLEFIPDDYSCYHDAADGLAATKFLSKSTFLKTGVNLQEVAIRKFFEAEAQCKATNRRIVLSEYNHSETATIIMIARRKIERILGDFCGEELIEACNWGPGATTALKRREANHPKKYDVERCITREAYDFCAPWVHEAFPLWKPTLCIDGASKIVTVPKNAKTDRTIAIEPGINLWFQKACGTMIRRRLRRIGIDLDDQTHNQRLARVGSKYGHLATIDFSAASDTISFEVVRSLLPPKWFCLLRAVRSSFGTLKRENGKKETVFFHKFSSMGNGFTFELESLIFYSIALACCDLLGIKPEGVSVFGDDVIIPSTVASYYAAITADLGFTVNPEKSFSSGPYRESCGEHYWNGVCMKPYFQKEPLNEVSSVLKAANGVRRLAHRRNSYGCDKRFRNTWQLLRSLLGRNTPVIPDGFGDSALIGNFTEASGVKKARDGLEGYLVAHWATIPGQRYVDSGGLLMWKLKQIGSVTDDSVGNLLAVGHRSRIARKRLLIPRWVDLGPWT